VKYTRRPPRLLPRMLFRVARATRPLFRLDLAGGRLRLDRLGRNGAGSTFFPGLSPFLARQQSLTGAIPPLSLRPASGVASSIASGFPIAIEAAVVAARDSQGEVTWRNRFLQEGRQRVAGRDRHPERPDQGRPHRPRATGSTTTLPATGFFVGRAEIGAAWSKRSKRGPRLPPLKLERSELSRRPSTPTSSRTKTARATD